MNNTQIGNQVFLPRLALEDLIRLLRSQGYTVIGPTVLDAAVCMRPIESADQVPRGVRGQQNGGIYRLIEGDPELRFEYVVGPDGPKRYVFPPSLPLFQFHVQGDRFVLDAGPPQVPKLAFLGVRPCELAAVKVQDRVFGMDDSRTFRCESEAWYTQARQQSLFLVVNCTSPSGTCFCASWGTGPEATEGFDLALTELRNGFVVKLGSENGVALVQELPVREPTGPELELRGPSALRH